MPERIVAVSLLTQPELDRLGESLRIVYPLNGVDDFAELLRAIDAADDPAGTARRDRPR